jgi:hypothetical protein
MHAEQGCHLLDGIVFVRHLYSLLIVPFEPFYGTIPPLSRTILSLLVIIRNSFGSSIPLDKSSAILRMDTLRKVGGRYKILVVDGQGGRIGKRLVEQIRAEIPGAEVTAVGTTASRPRRCSRRRRPGATGENPAVYNCLEADIVVGPIGIVIANSLLGEVTPAMAAALGQCKAHKVLIPVNRCNHTTSRTGTPSRGIHPARRAGHPSACRNKERRPKAPFSPLYPRKPPC